MRVGTGVYKISTQNKASHPHRNHYPSLSRAPSVIAMVQILLLANIQLYKTFHYMFYTSKYFNWFNVDFLIHGFKFVQGLSEFVKYLWPMKSQQHVLQIAFV